ncbi:hypothetical protein GCM10010402_42430 [Actinomadura luteofluorescens]
MLLILRARYLGCRGLRLYFGGSRRGLIAAAGPLTIAGRVTAAVGSVTAADSARRRFGARGLCLRTAPVRPRVLALRRKSALTAFAGGSLSGAVGGPGVLE